jgi:lysyl-tRNA synthetase class 2
MSEQENTEDLPSLIAQRQSKLDHLKDEGKNPYPNDFRRSDVAADLHAAFDGLEKEEIESRSVSASVAGRVLLKRVMGKASFLTVQDYSGRIQIYVTRDALGEAAYAAFKTLDIGDIVGVQGTLMKTMKGELSIDAGSVRLLTKSLRPLPEKHKGLTDTETRYRQRYVDLIVNEESQLVFRRRAEIIDGIRRFLIDRRFMEVETPMMQAIPGGATAQPFVTHYNALDQQMYLRVAPELNLKRLVVGGIEQVFEINRNFRNEGVSTKHSPEFTMLEFYWAYADYNDLMDLTENLFRVLADNVLGKLRFSYQGAEIDFGQPFARMTMRESILAYCADITAAEVDDASSCRRLLSKAGVAIKEEWGLGRLHLELFEAMVEDKLEQPTFIMQHPIGVSPLARRNDETPELTDRFELFIAGKEIANGFSELNDPADQAERFRDQVAAKEAGDQEAMHYDADYITALEYGLPPTAGEGIGIDRLVMLLTDSASIRDVILFPHLRRREAD